MLFKELFAWVQDKSLPKNPAKEKLISPPANSSETIQQTCNEINALIEFIGAYERDNAENLKREQEIEARLLHRKLSQ